MEPIKGLHHVTAIAGEPQVNVDFYAGILGLRLVKRTVNFDDPGTYHLYFGDELGRPGTIMTFFPWPGAPKGRRGSGQTTATAFTVPQGSIDGWMDRLARLAVDFDAPETRFGERVVGLDDPDGLRIELIEGTVTGRPHWAEGPVGEPLAIRGFHGVTLTESDVERSAVLLAGTMGFQRAAVDGSRHRFTSGHPECGSVIDIVHAPDTPKGRVAVGTVHHIAFRSVSDADQLDWQKAIAGTGTDVTDVMDRQYFNSIYFHEPGGVLFEIATDPPGFTKDEEPKDLGTHLKLPPWLEPHRGRIEDVLLPLRMPKGEPG